MKLSPNLTGALFMSVSVAAFAFNDAAIKALSISMNIGQIMFLRGIVSTALVAAVAWHRGALRVPAMALNRMVGLRTAAEMLATVSFLAALANLPLANASAILQALPLVVAMGAALFLGEPVGLRRWIAIGAGFLGVMLVVRPGLEGFDRFSLLALLAVFFSAVRDLATRRTPAEISSLFISTLTCALVMVAGMFLIVPLGGWSPVDPVEMWLILVSGVLVMVGYHFIVLAMRVGDISFIAPFRYTGLLWSILLGLVMFGEIPDLFMIAGGAVIVGSGIYMLYRERRSRRRGPVAESVGPAIGTEGL